MKKKNNALKTSEQYIVNESGKKTHVIVEIAVFEELLEQLEDFYFGLKAIEALKDDEYIDFEDAKNSLSKSKNKQKKSKTI